jgi:hypothetical protein
MLNVPFLVTLGPWVTKVKVPALQDPMEDSADVL